MRRIWLVVGLMGVLASTPVAAQSVVGSSVVNGRQVQILADYTWRYSSTTPTSCLEVEANVVFCGLNRGWTKTSNNQGDIDATFRLNDRNYGLFIVEGVGSEEGMSRELMRTAILGNAAKASGLQTKDVPTFGLEATKVGLLEAETISYAVKMEGLPIIFTNTVVIDKHRTIQIATYSLGQSPTEDMKAVHKQFLDATQLK